MQILNSSAWNWQSESCETRIKELERIYGVREGSAGKSEPKLSDGNIFNQSDIAEMIGISVDTLNNYKKLTELIPELEDLVDTVLPQNRVPFLRS